MISLWPKQLWGPPKHFSVRKTLLVRAFVSANCCEKVQKNLVSDSRPQTRTYVSFPEMCLKTHNYRLKSLQNVSRNLKTSARFFWLLIHYLSIHPLSTDPRRPLSHLTQLFSADTFWSHITHPASVFTLIHSLILLSTISLPSFTFLSIWLSLSIFPAFHSHIHPSSSFFILSTITLGSCAFFKVEWKDWIWLLQLKPP